MISLDSLKRILEREMAFHDHIMALTIIPITSSNSKIDYYKIKFSSATNPRFTQIIVETEQLKAISRAVDEFLKFRQLALDNQNLKNQIKRRLTVKGREIIVHGTENTNVFEILAKGDHNHLIDDIASLAKELELVLYLKPHLVREVQNGTD